MPRVCGYSVMNNLKPGQPVPLVDADPQFAIGIVSRGLVTATAAPDDLREEDTDTGMDLGCGSTGTQHRDFNITFINAPPCCSLMQRQNTGTKVQEVRFQGGGKCSRIPGTQTFVQAGHWHPRQRHALRLPAMQPAVSGQADTHIPRLFTCGKIHVPVTRLSHTGSKYPAARSKT